MKKLSLLLAMIMVTSLVFTVSCVSKEVPVTETYYETEYRTEYKTESYTATEDVVAKTVEGSELLSIKRQWRTSYVYLVGSQASFTCYYGYSIGTQEHSNSHVQISFTLQPELHKGIVYVIDLTGACHDQSIRYPDELFGYLHSIIDEGCQIEQPTLQGGLMGGITPGVAEVEYIKRWVDGFNPLIENPARTLGKLLVEKATIGDYITFDAKGIKEFAVVIGVKPEIKPSSVELTWSDDIIEKREITKVRQVPYEVPVQVEKQRTVMQTKKVPFWEVIFGE
ncbi:MAG: hypothetical protein FJ005_08500 [Chloroflexi bacterium]|nr:hypothetical protein [Chloroflexota bacterium]